MTLIFINNIFKLILLNCFRHLKPLLICGFLLILSIKILIYLWSYHLVCNWLLAFSSLNIQVIIKVLVTLAIYSLNIINDHHMTFEDKLDDYVFYIKSFGYVVILEFL